VIKISIYAIHLVRLLAETPHTSWFRYWLWNPMSSRRWAICFHRSG